MAMLTIWSSNYLLVRPLTTLEGIKAHRSDLDFALLTISVVLIMAGGNAVNDLYDEKTDVINKRENLTVRLGRKITWMIYGGLSFGGLMAGLALCLKIGHIGLWAVHVGAAFLLFWYSASLKGTPLGGNMLVALLCGLLPILPLIFEKSEYLYFLKPEYFMISFLALFATLITLVRELVKDLEDMEGDAVTGKLSLPVVLGEKAGRSLAVIFLLSHLMLLIALGFVTARVPASVIYISIFLFLPSIVLLILLIRSRAPSAYHKVSRALKYIMLSGLGYIVLYHYTCL